MLICLSIYASVSLHVYLNLIIVVIQNKLTWKNKQTTHHVSSVKGMKSVFQKGLGNLSFFPITNGPISTNLLLIT